MRPKGWTKRNLQEVVLITEALAARNGGLIPAMSKLFASGYGYIYHYMRAYPKLFAHLKMENLYADRRTPAMWVPVAEALAKKHGGFLPPTAWLVANGYGQLYAVMTKFPALFIHIPRVRLVVNRTLDQWVVVAEQLAKAGGGVLDYHYVLTNHPALGAAMVKYPERFAHIPIKRRKKPMTQADWVPVAERMMVENGGSLQHPGWLLKNGFTGLCSALYRSPHLFDHVVQQVHEGTRGETTLIGFRGGTPEQREYAFAEYMKRNATGLEAA